jgi:uncharacterized membrane protein
MKNSGMKTLGKLSVLAFGSAMLVACGDHGGSGSTSGSASLVKCYGVAKTDKPLVLTKAICNKLASTKVVPIVNEEATKPVAVADYKADYLAPTKTSDYVKCYGVAAASQNDCATKTTSCAGSAKKAKQPDAWVSLPPGLCEKLKDGKVG